MATARDHRILNIPSRLVDERPVPAVLLSALRLVRQAVPHVVEGVVGPAAAFVIGHRLYGLLGAVGLAFAWTAACLAVRTLFGSRRISGLLALASITVVLRTIVGLVAHSTTAFFLGPDIITAGMGLAFVISAFTSKPLVARVATDFLPATWFDPDNPRAARICKAGSLAWGGEQILSSVVTAILVFHFSATTFATLHEPISIGVFVVVMGALLPFFLGDIRALRPRSGEASTGVDGAVDVAGPTGTSGLALVA